MQSISPRFRPLQPFRLEGFPILGRPNSHPHRSMPVHRPWLICRNFVYGGVCKEMSCPRAHVPHRDMLDLLDYFITRRDFPAELRSARKQLRPPKLSLCRVSLPSDRICSAFIPRPCPWGMKCTRAHFSVDNVYRSLMWPVDRAVAPQLGSEVPSATPVDPTTCAFVPTPANGEQFVVKLPRSKAVPLDDHDSPLDVSPNDSPLRAKQRRPGPSRDPLHSASQSRTPSNVVR
ncbi:hypothetical protein EDB83DRAFT_2358384 [Lactarius deliciosus]|nr:hypothetical protein EDB83DRAFT_2358384 [Lactarius deliciosus]